MNTEQLNVLRHALGVGPTDVVTDGLGSRNHFVTGEGSRDHSLCIALVKAGMMAKVNNVNPALTGGGDLFRVTGRGMRAVFDARETPPKLTRSQARYRRWLDEDGSQTFREWLRTERAR